MPCQRWVFAGQLGKGKKEQDMLLCTMMEDLHAHLNQKIRYGLALLMMLFTRTSIFVHRTKSCLSSSFCSSLWSGSIIEKTGRSYINIRENKYAVSMSSITWHINIASRLLEFHKILIDRLVGILLAFHLFHHPWAVADGENMGCINMSRSGQFLTTIFFKPMAYIFIYPVPCNPQEAQAQ